MKIYSEIYRGHVTFFRNSGNTGTSKGLVYYNVTSLTIFLMLKLEDLCDNISNN